MNKFSGLISIVLAVIAVIFVMVFINYYNSLQTLDEKRSATAAEVINQYQRRSDLITNLVSTVKGYTKHESEIFTAIAESRNQLKQIAINPDDLKDNSKLEAFSKIQSSMQTDLSRLMVYVENYPDLKASSLYQNLMAQIEGSENRVTVARNRYIEMIQEYNTTIRKVPYVFFAKALGYSPLPQFKAESEEAMRAPVISF